MQKNHDYTVREDRQVDLRDLKELVSLISWCKGMPGSIAGVALVLIDPKGRPSNVEHGDWIVEDENGGFWHEPRNYYV